MKALQITSEYECSPLWLLNQEGFFEPVEVEELIEIPDYIRNEIINWNKKYQSTYNSDDPRESGFNSKIEEEIHDEEGIKIWKELAFFLKDYKIIYSSYVNNVKYIYDEKFYSDE